MKLKITTAFLIVSLAFNAYLFNDNMILEDDLKMVIGLFNEVNHENTILKKENHDLIKVKRLRDDLSK